jgi:hypothetical protein
VQQEKADKVCGVRGGEGGKEQSKKERKPTGEEAMEIK